MGLNPRELGATESDILLLKDSCMVSHFLGLTAKAVVREVHGPRVKEIDLLILKWLLVRQVWVGTLGPRCWWTPFLKFPYTFITQVGTNRHSFPKAQYCNCFFKKSTLKVSYTKIRWDLFQGYKNDSTFLHEINLQSNYINKMKHKTHMLISIDVKKHLTKLKSTYD